METSADKLEAKAEGQAGLGRNTVLVESVVKHFKGTQNKFDSFTEMYLINLQKWRLC
jgi:hypothetical protein